MLKNKKLTQITLCLLFAITFIVAGCSDAEKGLKRFKVSGTVTFDGKPVPFGMITFTPDSAKGNEGPQGFAKIIDGKFNTTSGNGRGIIGGAHQIKINGTSEENSGEMGPDDMPITPKPLFKTYKTEFDFPKEDATKDFVVE